MAYVSAAGQRPEDALGKDETPAAESTDIPEADSAPNESPELAPSAKAAVPEQPEEDDDEDDEDEGSRKRFVKKYD